MFVKTVKQACALRSIKMSWNSSSKSTLFYFLLNSISSARYGTNWRFLHEFSSITCPTKALLGQLDKDFGNWSIWDFNCNLTRFGKHKTNNKITTSSRKSFQYFFFYLDCNRLPAKTLMNFDENSLYKINN